MEGWERMELIIGWAVLALIAWLFMHGCHEDNDKG